MLNSMEGNEIVESVVGPMSHSADSLELFVRTVVSAEPWLDDPKCHPIPWRQDVSEGILNGRKLRIGVQDWDGCVLPQPPVRRAMRELEQRLRVAGHEIVPWRVDQTTALAILVCDIALRFWELTKLIATLDKSDDLRWQRRS